MSPPSEVAVAEADVLTTPEVSHLLGISIRTVQRRVDAGDLPYLRKLPGPNGAVIYRRSDVDAYADKIRREREQALATQAPAARTPTP